MIYFQGNIRVSLNHYNDLSNIHLWFLQQFHATTKEEEKHAWCSYWEPCNLPVGLLSTFTSYINLGSPHGCVCTVWQCNQNRKEIKYPGGTKHRAQMITSTYIFISFSTYICIYSFIFLYLMLQFTLNLARCKLQANFTFFITSFVIIQVVLSAIFLYFLEVFLAQGNIQQKLIASFVGHLIDFYHSVVDSFCM